jgi:hypothetical protein
LDDTLPPARSSRIGCLPPIRIGAVNWHRLRISQIVGATFRWKIRGFLIDGRSIGVASLSLSTPGRY